MIHCVQLEMVVPAAAPTRSVEPITIKKHDPSLRDGGKSYVNVSGPGSMEYSERVIQAYMNRYATKARLGRKVTDQDIARIHNGGPNGFRNSSTLKKVQAYLLFYSIDREINKE